MRYAIVAAAACIAAWFLIAAPHIELAELNHATAAAKVVELQQLDEQRVDLIQHQQL